MLYVQPVRRTSSEDVLAVYRADDDRSSLAGHYLIPSSNPTAYARVAWLPMTRGNVSPVAMAFLGMRLTHVPYCRHKQPTSPEASPSSYMTTRSSVPI